MFKCVKNVLTESFVPFSPYHASWHNQIVYMPLKLRLNYNSSFLVMPDNKMLGMLSKILLIKHKKEHVLIIKVKQVNRTITSNDK